MPYGMTYEYSRHYKIVSFSTILLLASVLLPQIQLTYAGGKSPYDAGYVHGCDDAGISTPSDRYINEPGKGPSSHTDEFMQGYNAGYNNCSDGDSNTASGSSQTNSYDDGYDEGCYDAGRDLKGLNGHGYDDSINHGNSQFRVGYVDGYRACWDSGNSEPAPATGRELSNVSGIGEPNTSPNPLTNNNRYYDGYDWRGVCNNPFASKYIGSQSCDTLVTPDGNALTSQGKPVMEAALCPHGQGVIGTLEFFVGSIPDHLESELAAACGW